MGALHPILFFAGVYMVALFFSIFICSSLFYSCNSSTNALAKEATERPAQNTSLASVSAK